MRAVLALGLAGCWVSSAPPPTTAPPTAPPPVATPVAVQQPPPPSVALGAPCSATLVVSHMRRSSPSCFVDEVVTSSPGTLTYPCGGGDAEAVFGGTSRFAGWVREGLH